MAWGSAPVCAFAEALGNDGGTGGSHTTSGDTLFWTIGQAASGSVTGLADSKGNNWTLVKKQLNGSGLGTSLYRSDTPAIVGSGHTFTANLTASRMTIAVMGFNGGATSGIDDATPVGAGNTFAGTIQPGSFTPSVANTLIVTSDFNSDDHRNPSTIDSGFTIGVSYDSTGSFDVNVGLAYLVQGAASAVNPTWTFAGGTSVHEAAAIANFIAAASGGSDNPIAVPQGATTFIGKLPEMVVSDRYAAHVNIKNRLAP